MIDEPVGTQETQFHTTGGWVAAPIVGKVIQQIAPILNVVPIDENTPSIRKALTIPSYKPTPEARTLASFKLINKGTSTLRQDWTNVEIKGLSADSRNVRPGYLFAAIPGNLADGRNYIDAAIAAGASAILAPTGTKQPISNENIPFITDINPRQRLAHMAARFFGKQPENVVAVTGTNGKTSVAHFAQQLWTLAGAKAASLGTLGVTGPGYPARGGLTTPGPVALQKTLSDLKVDQCDHLCIEASSHGLDQNRSTVSE